MEFTLDDRIGFTRRPRSPTRSGGDPTSGRPPQSEWFGATSSTSIGGSGRVGFPENTLVSQTRSALVCSSSGTSTSTCRLYTNRDIRNRVDMASLDLDVERILLNPLGSTPVFEAFPEFSVSMSHSSRTPNEAVDPQQNLTDPELGLTSNFDGNQLSLVEDAPSSSAAPAWTSSVRATDPSRRTAPCSSPWP